MVNAPVEWDITEYKDLDSINYYDFVKKVTDKPHCTRKGKGSTGSPGARSSPPAHAVGCLSQRWRLYQ